MRNSGITPKASTNPSTMMPVRAAHANRPVSAAQATHTAVANGSPYTKKAMPIERSINRPTPTVTAKNPSSTRSRCFHGTRLPTSHQSTIASVPTIGPKNIPTNCKRLAGAKNCGK